MHSCQIKYHIRKLEICRIICDLLEFPENGQILSQPVIEEPIGALSSGTVLFLFADSELSTFALLVLYFSYLVVVKFEEQKEVVAVERILRVVFIDPQRAPPVSNENTIAFKLCLHYRKLRAGSLLSSKHVHRFMAHLTSTRFRGVDFEYQPVFNQLMPIDMFNFFLISSLQVGPKCLSNS